MRRLAPLVLAVLAAGPAAASASMVSYSPPPPCGEQQSKYMLCDPSVVTFSDPAGQADRLTLSREGDRYVFSDEASPLTAGSGCEQRSERVAACPRAERVQVSLGAGDDVITGGGVSASVDGGAGNDRLLDVTIAAGGPGNDELRAGPFLGQLLDGGEGDDAVAGGDLGDVLVGGAGWDRLTGGGGDDRLTGDGVPSGANPAPADLLDGGEGMDAASYGERREPVAVDLADPGPDGGAGENDLLLRIEVVAGGRGADRLTGDGGPNRFTGGRGDDVLDGAGGDDVLYGEGGRDTVVGGDGDDLLDGVNAYHGPGSVPIFDAGRERAGAANTFDCGDGDDTVTAAERFLSLVPADCEEMADWLFDLRPKAVVAEPYPRRLGRRRATFHVGCPPSDRRHRRCRGRLALSRAGGGRPLARRRFSVGRHGGEVELRTRRGDLRDAHRLHVRLVFSRERHAVEYLIAPGCSSPPC